MLSYAKAARGCRFHRAEYRSVARPMCASTRRCARPRLGLDREHALAAFLRVFERQVWKTFGAAINEGMDVVHRVTSLSPTRQRDRGCVHRAHVPLSGTINGGVPGQGFHRQLRARRVSRRARRVQTAAVLSQHSTQCFRDHRRIAGHLAADARRLSRSLHLRAGERRRPVRFARTCTDRCMHHADSVVVGWCLQGRDICRAQRRWYARERS